MDCIAIRIANDCALVSQYTPLTGTLICQSEKFYVKLSVPQALVDSVFEVIKNYEPNMEKSPKEAHISVMDDSDSPQFKSTYPLPEKGQSFLYEISGVYSVKPEGWEEMEKVWFIKCFSPNLSQLRTKYGLTPLLKEHEFHITVAIKRAKFASVIDKITASIKI